MSKAYFWRTFVNVIFIFPLLTAIGTLSTAAVSSETLQLSATTDYKFLFKRITRYELFTLPTQTKPADILNSDYEKKLTVTYNIGFSDTQLHDLTKDSLVKAWDEATLQQYDVEISGFLNSIQGVEKNDQYIIYWQPAKGLSIHLNETPLFQTQNISAANIILSLWLGKAVPSPKLRDRLINQWRAH